MTIFLLLLSLLAATPRTFAVDPSRSRATIDVGKSGAFSFAGHTHEVDAPIKSGVIHLDTDMLSRCDVRLEFDAAALRVTGKGESADDVPKVQQTMLGPQVLDVKNYPAITFESISVTGRGAPPVLDLTIAGRLTIHGVTKTVTVPVSVSVDGRSVTATGRFAVTQTAFGIKPISIGGVVKVKDELAIAFSIAGEER